jgi:hypothetical protein
MEEWPSLRHTVRRLFRFSGQKKEAIEPLKGALVVRRGLSPDYYFFLDVFAKNNNAEIIVDRRVTERRRLPRNSDVERRSVDRRDSLPATWLREGCLMVGLPYPNKQLE